MAEQPELTTEKLDAALGLIGRANALTVSAYWKALDPELPEDVKLALVLDYQRQLLARQERQAAGVKPPLLAGPAAPGPDLSALVVMAATAWQNFVKALQEAQARRGGG